MSSSFRGTVRKSQVERRLANKGLRRLYANPAWQNPEGKEKKAARNTLFNLKLVKHVRVMVVGREIKKKKREKKRENASLIRPFVFCTSCM